MLNEEKVIDYKNIDFLLEKSKEALSKNKELTRTDIADLITKENPKKHAAVYELLGKVLNKDYFTNKKGKYSLKM